MCGKRLHIHIASQIKILNPSNRTAVADLGLFLKGGFDFAKKSAQSWLKTKIRSQPAVIDISELQE